MELIEGAVRSYDWGSLTAIPDLLGRPATGEPWAELWLGAHPAAPATVGARAEPLDRLIASDPAAALGSAVASRYGRLPFLPKVLAAAAPLSLQAHPSAEQAAAGFEREEAMGIPLDAPRRMFRDRSAKPELICALSGFEALCGFRDPLQTAALLDTLDAPALDPLRRRLQGRSGSQMRDLLAWLIALDGPEAAALAEVVDGTASDAPVQRPEPVDGVVTYCTTAAEFSLRRLDVDGSSAVAAGPAVLLCTEGCVEVNGVTLDRGAAAWSDAREPRVAVEGRGTLFCASVGAGG